MRLLHLYTLKTMPPGGLYSIFSFIGLQTL
jgi:hypothetical protein